MNKDFVLKLVLGLVTLVWPVVLAWNGYLHSSMQANRETVQAVRLKIAEDYVSTEDMDKFIARMEKRFDRLDAKIDSK